MRLPTVIVARHIAQLQNFELPSKAFAIGLILLCSLPQAALLTAWEYFVIVESNRESSLHGISADSSFFSAATLAARGREDGDHVEISALETGSERPRAREAS